MNRIFLLCGVFLSFILTMGCNSTGGMKKPDISAILPPGPPAKTISAWEPAVKHEGNSEEPKRGFGGRVYFYDQEGKRPIKIKGNVVVYAFDEDERKSDDAVPTRSYLFDNKDLKQLYSKSKLGHSYNFWVPWDSEGPDGKAKKISLIVRYVPDVGPSVISSQAVVYLPGKSGQTELMAKKEWDQQLQSQNTIKQVSYLTRGSQEKDSMRNGPMTQERLVESNNARPAVMQTATITVPNGYSQGMQAALGTPSPRVASSVASPVAPSAILPVNYLQEKAEPASSDTGPSSKPAEKQGENRDFLNDHVRKYADR